MPLRNVGAPSSAATDLATRGDVSAMITAAGTGGGFPNTSAEAIRDSAVAMTSGAFTQITLPTTSVDPGSNYNSGTSLYTVPSTGLYLCFGRVRIPDNSGTSGASFGLGIHTSVGDGTWFFWGQVPSAQRKILDYRRLAYFNAGNQLRFFYYYDGASVPSIQLASMQIVRLA